MTSKYLKQIKAALDRGATFYMDVRVCNPALLSDFPSGFMPSDVLWRHLCYYHWSNYGSSAVKANAKDLAWVIRHMFKTTPKAFLAKYKTQERERWI